MLPQRGSASQSTPAVRRLRIAVRVIARGLVLALAAMTAACSGDRGAAPDQDIPKIVLGTDSHDSIPQSELVAEVAAGTYLSDLTFDGFDGAPRTIADYRGIPLVVNFFAAWCPPCVREMPEFQDVYASLDGRVAFLGLSQDRSPEDALDLVQRTGVTYDVGWDPDLEVYSATGSLAMPTTAFVSPDGELLDTFAGALDAAALTDRIEAVLNIAS